MKQLEFTIKSRTEQFRTTKIETVEILSIAPLASMDDYSQNMQVFNFILDHVEVNLNGLWTVLRDKKTHAYMLGDIEDDAIALNEIIAWFLQNVIYSVFQKSSE